MARLRDIPDSIDAEYAGRHLNLYDPAIRPSLGPTLYVGGWVSMEKDEVGRQEVLNKALKYVKRCRDHPKYEPRVIKLAVELRDDLPITAGTLEGAIRGLREARQQVIGVPTAGATSKEVLRCLSLNTPTTSKQ